MLPGFSIIFRSKFINGRGRKAEGKRAFRFCSVLCALHSALINFAHDHKMSLVPVDDTRKWHFVAELFPGEPVAAGAEAYTFGSIADTKH